jgi:signal transduction histidine kinase
LAIEVRNPARTDGQPAASGGHGLVGMRERVASLAGRFAAAPADDGTFRVLVEIPRPAS